MRKPPNPTEWRESRKTYQDEVTVSQRPTSETSENPFLILGFWEFAIISTLMFVFFPWSLLFCLFFYGMENTKLIVIALFHDWIKTLLAVLSVLVPIIILIVIFVVWVISSN